MPRVADLLKKGTKDTARSYQRTQRSIWINT
jgi:hypothetical protein